MLGGNGSSLFSSNGPAAASNTSTSNGSSRVQGGDGGKPYMNPAAPLYQPTGEWACGLASRLATWTAPAEDEDAAGPRGHLPP